MAPLYAVGVHKLLQEEGGRDGASVSPSYTRTALLQEICR